METLIIEALKLIIPSIVALIVFWTSQKRAKSLGIDDTAKQYEDIQTRLKTALQEDLKEAKDDYASCKERLAAAEERIKQLVEQIKLQDSTIFDLRLDISKLQSRSPRTRGRKTDGPN